MLHVAVYRNRKRNVSSNGAIVGVIQPVKRHPAWLWMWLAGQRHKPWPQSKHAITTELGPLSIRVSWGNPSVTP